MRGGTGGDADSWRLNYARLLIRDCLAAGHRVQLDGGKIRFIPLRENMNILPHTLRWWVAREFGAQTRKILRRPLSAGSATGAPPTTRTKAARKSLSGHISVS